MFSNEEENYFEGDGNVSEGEACQNKLLSGMTANQFKDVEIENVVDGVVFMSSNLGFFRLDPPFDFGNVFIDAKARIRFKGIETWMTDFDNLLELRFGRVHNHTLSILFAYKGHKIIEFKKLIQAVRTSFIESIGNLPDTALAKLELNNSVSEKIVFRNRNDFHCVQNLLRVYLNHNFGIIRSDNKFTFVLYKFGQSINCIEFCQEVPWLRPTELEGIILHYAKDHKLANHILWFIPAAVKLVLGPTSRIYHTGIQPGLGNIRHEIKTKTDQLWLPTHVTLYTRIWQEMHRDPLGFFSRYRLGTSLVSAYVNVFKSGNQKVNHWTKSDFALRNRVPNVIRSSAKLAKEYTSRVELVSYYDLANLSTANLDDVISLVIQKSDDYITNKRLNMPGLFYPQRTDEFKTKITQWFEHFAGTIENTCDLVDQIVLLKQKMADGEIIKLQLHIFKQIIAIYAVDYLLTLCYNGNIVCTNEWRHKLNISKTDILKGTLEYAWTFKGINRSDEDGKKLITLKATDAVFYKQFDRIFRAKIPFSYEQLYKAASLLSDFKEEFAFVFINRKELQNKTTTLAALMVDLFISISSQYSQIEINANNPTLLALVSDAQGKAMEDAQVVTNEEFVKLLRGETVKNQQFLDYRFWMYRNVCAKVCVEERDSKFWNILASEFQNKILSNGYPIVCQRAFYNCKDTNNIIIVPSFQMDINNTAKFNNAWKIAALLLLNESIPDIGGIKNALNVYECLLNLPKKQLKMLNAGCFINAVAAVKNFATSPTGVVDCQEYHDLTKHCKNLLHGNNLYMETETSSEQTSKQARDKGKFKKNLQANENSIKPSVHDRSDEELLADMNLFMASRGKNDVTKDVSTLTSKQMLKPCPFVNANSEMGSFESYIPFTLKEVADSFQGTCWMDVEFLNCCIYSIQRKYSTKNTRSVVLHYSACTIPKDEWTCNNQALQTITLDTEKIYHIMFLKNHYVLVTCDMLAIGDKIELNVKTYDTLKIEGSYTTLLQRGCEHLIQILMQRLISLRVSTSQPTFVHAIKDQNTVQQGDSISCGPACIRIAEHLIRKFSQDAHIWKMTLQQYKERIVIFMLKLTDAGSKLCEYYVTDKNQMFEFLKTIK